MVVDRLVRHLSSEPWESLRPGPVVADLEDVTLLAPCLPSKIIAVGRNYAAHAAEHGAEVPAEPLIFLKPPSAVIGPQQAIVYPERLSQHVDHEAELVVVIGRRARRVRRVEALAYVLGYTCANDVTARDLQQRDGQWARSKGFDTFCPLGPWIVTDLNITDTAVRCRVNTELRQDGRTSDMVFGVDELIAYASAVMTLEPGDLILTGTPAGVGPMLPGDRVAVEIEGIGVLENEVVRYG
jgi:2-keto-4-pentenoate hydratase/2-oxohepta-3-ene-1,7-dioic acid hydratase in catechol pathway